MDEKPSLVVFSQYKLGGVQSFYSNILSHDPYKAFDVKWIFVDHTWFPDARPPGPYGKTEEIIFTISNPNEDPYALADRLYKLIPPGPGIVVTNFEVELQMLHIKRPKNKTIIFICHDELYVPVAQKFAFLIDVFIAHNEHFYQQLRELLPEREADIFYKPYGVRIPPATRQANPSAPLRIVMAARLHTLKGIHDIPLIDDALKAKGITVEWTIMGDGPEKKIFQDAMIPRGNCRFHRPDDDAGVRDLLQQNDVFILPSRLDGLPVALLEAMSVGCVPVISKFNNGISKVVTEDIGFVLMVGDNEAFVESITRLHQNREELETRSAAARRKIELQYDINARAKDYFDLFRERIGVKKAYEFKPLAYGGLLNHPMIPSFVRWSLRKIKSLVR